MICLMLDPPAPMMAPTEELGTLIWHISTMGWGGPPTPGMNGVLGHNSALQGYTGLGTNWANEMNFVTNHAAGAWSIADLLASSPEYYHSAMDAPRASHS